MRSVLPIGSLALFLVLSSFLTGGSAQGRTNSTGTGGIHQIKGRIYLPDGRSPDLPMKVELQSYDVGTLSVETDRSGAYSFQGLAPGNYRVVVNAGDPFEPTRDSVTIEGELQTSTFRVPPIPKIIQVP